MKVIGDACSVCLKRQEIGGFLMKIRAVTNTGYLDTEVCFECLVDSKKDYLKEMLNQDNVSSGGK